MPNIVLDAAAGTISGLAVGGIQGPVITPGNLTQAMTLAVAQATTSGTSFDFTGIPAWAKRITGSIAGVGTNGASLLQIRIGSSGGIESTGYLGTSGSTAQFSSGFLPYEVWSAALVISGQFVLTLVSANTWAFSVSMGRSDSVGSGIGAGSKVLTGTLDRLRFTTVSGTDTFRVGSFNIMYEG